MSIFVKDLCKMQGITFLLKYNINLLNLLIYHIYSELNVFTVWYVNYLSFLFSFSVPTVCMLPALKLSKETGTKAFQRSVFVNPVVMVTELNVATGTMLPSNS